MYLYFTPSRSPRRSASAFTSAIAFLVDLSFCFYANLNCNSARFAAVRSPNSYSPPKLLPNFCSVRIFAVYLIFIMLARATSAAFPYLPAGLCGFLPKTPCESILKDEDESLSFSASHA